jgi:hypothetical protein
MEGVYIMHTRECININLPIYKFGRSHNLDKRVKQYPTGSKIMFQIYCSDSILCEKNLIELFTNLFIRKKNYGNEYFEGDIDEMIFTIIKYLYGDKFCKKMNTKLPIYNIEPVKKVVKVKKGEESTKVEEITKVAKVAKVAEVTEVEEVIVNKDRICPNPICSEKFKYPSGLKRHFETSYHCKKEQKEIDLYFCNINQDKKQKNICHTCNIEFTKNFLLIRHLNYNKCISPISSNIVSINKGERQIQKLSKHIQELTEQIQITNADNLYKKLKPKKN